MAEPLTWENAIPALLDRVPELRSVYQRLLGEEVPPIGPYTLMHAAVSFAEDLCHAVRDGDVASPRAAEPLRRLMAALEEMATSDDPYLKDLMGAGFVEDMHVADPCFDYLVALMGPVSRQVVVEMFAPPWQWGQRPRSEDKSERN